MDDIIDLLVTEHRALERLFADVETTSDRVLRREVLEAAIATPKEHAAKEERYLYPVTRTQVPCGDVLADHELREHADAGRMIDRIHDLEDTDPEFDPLVTSLMTTVRHHVQEEESEIFPRLRNACPEETRRELCEQAGQQSGINTELRRQSGINTELRQQVAST
jgi:hemerythrin superfamily protein